LSHPLLINQFGTERPDVPSLRARDSLERRSAASSAERVSRDAGAGPQVIAEKVRGLKKLKSIADRQPKEQSAAGPLQRWV